MSAQPSSPVPLVTVEARPRQIEEHLRAEGTIWSSDIPAFALRLRHDLVARTLELDAKPGDDRSHRERTPASFS